METKDKQYWDIENYKDFPIENTKHIFRKVQEYEYNTALIFKIKPEHSEAQAFNFLRGLIINHYEQDKEIDVEVLIDFFGGLEGYKLSVSKTRTVAKIVFRTVAVIVYWTIILVLAKYCIEAI